MKPFLLLFLILPALARQAAAQTTIRPSCYSNAAGWVIEKVDQAYDATYVYLSVYTYSTNYRFYIQSGMYVENYNDPSAGKYVIESFVDNQLDHLYSLQPNTKYDFVLKFQRIPAGWTDINIKESNSDVSGFTPWHWDYISLNKPSTERLKLDNFLLNDGIQFLKQSVHPLTNLQFYRYSVDYNTIRVTLYYEGGYVTDLKIDLYLDLVSNINIVYDNDFVAPFTVLEVIRDVIMQQDKDQRSTSRVEQYLRKQISEMSGKELASIALTAMWNNRPR